MKFNTIKKIITGGCSFSTYGYKTVNSYNWVDAIENAFPEIKFRHTACAAQGQELIQKKVSIALIEELEHYRPEELCVIVVWSSSDRKAFYVNNSDFISRWKNNCTKLNFSRIDTLLNLYNRIEECDVEIIVNNKTKEITRYNKNGGWYHFTTYNINDCSFVKEFYSLNSDNLAATITSLENIIFLQNLCKLKNVKFLQGFFINQTLIDINEYKNNLNINYLYKQLDFNSIISDTGIFDYLKSKNNHEQYFLDNLHPTLIGSTKWLDEVLIPKLTERGFLNGSA